MSRFDYRKLSQQESSELIGELLQVLDSVKQKKDLQKFFLQLVTPSEAVMLARRWQIAKLLATGKSYLDIAEQLHVGKSTIQLVDQWLSAAIGDYRTRLTEERVRLRRRHKGPSSPSLFPKTLPFLLVNLLIGGAKIMWWQTTHPSTPKK